MNELERYSQVMSNVWSTGYNSATNHYDDFRDYGFLLLAI